MKTKFLPALLLLALPTLPGIPVPANASPLQTTVASGNSDRISYRQLTWEDFQVNDTAPGAAAAQTHTYITFAHQARATGRPGSFEAKAVSLTFEGGFDRARSWRRSRIAPTNTTLLEHEQGHFDINEIALRQLQKIRLQDLPTGRGRSPEDAFKDLGKKIDKIYNDKIEELRRTQQRYDRETQHGIRRREQDEWTRRLRAQLNSEDR